MTVLSRKFIANKPLTSLIPWPQSPDYRIYTWDSSSFLGTSALLNSCLTLESEGWQVALEVPIPGLQRNSRVPIVALKSGAIVFVKPVLKADDVNLAGLKLLELVRAAQISYKGGPITAAVFAWVDMFDPSQRTNIEYEVWIRSRNVVSNQ